MLLYSLLTSYVPAIPIMHPVAIGGGLVAALALGILIGRATVKPQRLPLSGRVFQEPAGSALVEIALRRYGGGRR
jgi:hypothetical protein